MRYEKADDKRILINSHFTSSRKRTKFLIASTHHVQMIRALKDWLKDQNPSSQDGPTIIKRK